MKRTDRPGAADPAEEMRGLPESLSGILLEWYQRNRRILPWRDRGNAYYTWVSEIMLQQTRASAVIPYFERFIEALPDIHALAECPEELLLKLWEGLGYYSRVRNMHVAARQVEERFGGVLPCDPKELLSLKGIGSYTAGAIASIAYGVKAPAVDGNVLRVISRILDSHADIAKPAVKKRIEETVLAVMPEEHPGDFNQALMDLGALVCLPNGKPDCVNCPARSICRGYLNGSAELLPVKSSGKERRIVPKTVFVIRDGEKSALRKRPDRGLLAGLFELPNADGCLTEEEALDFVREMGLLPVYIRRLPDARHIFTHLEWNMQAYLVRVASREETLETRDTDLIFADKNERETSFAVPSAFSAYERYLD